MRAAARGRCSRGTRARANADGWLACIRRGAPALAAAAPERAMLHGSSQCRRLAHGDGDARETERGLLDRHGGPSTAAAVRLRFSGARAARQSRLPRQPAAFRDATATALREIPAHGTTASAVAEQRQEGGASASPAELRRCLAAKQTTREGGVGENCACGRRRRRDELRGLGTGGRPPQSARRLGLRAGLRPGDAPWCPTCRPVPETGTRANGTAVDSYRTRVLADSARES